MDLKAIAIGVKAGFLSSLCCIGALALVVLGIGTVSAALSLTQYRPYFIAASIIFMAAATWHHFKKCQQNCTLNKKQFITTMVTVYAIILLTLLYAVVPAIAPLILTASPGNTASAETSALQQVTLKIDGMTCPSCASIIENNLSKIKGIHRAEIDYEKGRGVVLYDPNIVTVEEILDGVKPYQASLVKDGV